MCEAILMYNMYTAHLHAPSLLNCTPVHLAVHLKNNVPLPRHC